MRNNQSTIYRRNRISKSKALTISLKLAIKIQMIKKQMIKKQMINHLTKKQQIKIKHMNQNLKFHGIW